MALSQYTQLYSELEPLRFSCSKVLIKEKRITLLQQPASMVKPAVQHKVKVGWGPHLRGWKNGKHQENPISVNLVITFWPGVTKKSKLKRKFQCRDWKQSFINTVIIIINVGDGNGVHLEWKKNHWGFISVIYNDFIKNNAILIK